MAIVDKI